ncbi:MAG: AEC family transporter [Chloroflexota bacterium]
MIQQLLGIFFDVITPVFLLVIIGYLVGPRLGLQPRTLSRAAYFLFVPSFIFNVISTARTEASLAVRMFLYIALVHIGLAILALIVGLVLKRPSRMISAYVLIAVFGNVGNFGLPLLEFRYGPEAVLPATVYFLALVIVAFVIGVFAASWQSGGGWRAMLSVLKTPAILAAVPAILINLSGYTLPLAVTRVTGLLGDAMIPVMLVTLGVTLASNNSLEINFDTLVATSLRLIGGPILAFALVGFFSLTGLERGTGILQSSMPAAVLVSIIAFEHDLMPEFVTMTVLFSTIASVVTLTILLAIV